tara:strand:- start:1478 stop:1882 length:405 start_codon:yes stop_codon:yes gene_type:complete
MKATAIRLRDDGIESLGAFFVYDGLDKLFECKTCELPWKGNKKNVSCIPRGVYHVTHRNSEKHGDHLHIEDVPNRTWILIHVVNFEEDLEGCMGVGKDFVDLDRDGDLDITSSRATLDKLIDIIPIEGIPLEII